MVVSWAVAAATWVLEAAVEVSQEAAVVTVGAAAMAALLATVLLKATLVVELALPPQMTSPTLPLRVVNVRRQFMSETYDPPVPLCDLIAALLTRLSSFHGPPAMKILSNCSRL